MSPVWWGRTALVHGPQDRKHLAEMIWKRGFMRSSVILASLIHCETNSSYNCSTSISLFPQRFLAHLSNCYFVCPYLLKSTFYSVRKYTKFIPRIIANPWCFLVLRATRVTYLHSSLQTRILSLNLFETSVFLRCMWELVRYTDSFQFPVKLRSGFMI